MGVKFQSRYVAYARAHGRTPEEQIVHDRDAWPGGCMCGFILWITERWTEWDTLTGHPRDKPHGENDHTAFDEWLGTKVAEVPA